jgi:hypothetical protein
VVQRGVRWRVGNGKSIHIWEDQWLPTPSTHKVISTPTEINDIPMVSSLIDEQTKSWRMDIVQQVFLPMDVDTIKNIPLSSQLPEDKLMWIGDRRGFFTVKSAYYIAQEYLCTSPRSESSNRGQMGQLWRALW